MQLVDDDGEAITENDHTFITPAESAFELGCALMEAAQLAGYPAVTDEEFEAYRSKVLHEL